MRIWLFLFSCFVSPLSFAEEFFTSDTFKRSHIGIYIQDVKTGELLYAKNAEEYFIPASLQKIATSVAALALLGEEYRFKTEFGYEGTIDAEGVLEGNLWIRGGGDPTLSLSCFAEWEERVKKAGIKKVKGKILVDSSCFENGLASPYWYFQDLGNYYGAGASGLTINNNLYHVTFKPGKKVGDPAEVIKLDPSIPDLIVHNEVTTGPAGSGDQVYIFGMEYAKDQFYRGTVPLDEPTFTVKGAIPDPASFCALKLKEKIETTEGIGFQKLEGKKALTLIESPPLKEIFKEMNGMSVNLFAEHLLKAMGKGRSKEGALIIEQFLKKQEIPCQVKDGSGLARSNYMTPKGFATLLKKIHEVPSYKSVFASFPEAGTPSTLALFPPIPGCVIKSKTGSMSDIYNLGGYLILPSGREIVFSIFCNHYLGPTKEIRREIHSFLTSFLKKQVLK